MIIIIMDYRSSDETERHCCTLVWLLSSIRETMNNHIILGALAAFTRSMLLLQYNIIRWFKSKILPPLRVL